MKRGINLRGFRLELKVGSMKVREAGYVLIWLMNKTSGYHDMEIAEYYATRGKLTNLNVIHGAHTALKSKGFLYLWTLFLSVIEAYRIRDHHLQHLSLGLTALHRSIIVWVELRRVCRSQIYFNLVH